MTIPGNLISSLFSKTATAAPTTAPTYSSAALISTLNNTNAYGTSANDYFGLSVSMDGNYAIVGAFAEDDAGGEMSGKAYIFNASTGQVLWTLNNPNAYGTSAIDQFGYSVGISGNYAIVSSHAEDDAGGLTSGKAYIFNVTTGALTQTLNNPNAYGTSAGDAFSGAVAISGNYAIVGAYAEADAGGLYSGKAYIFNVTTGALTQTLSNPNAYGLSETDFFGYLANGVDISGNYAIVGAPGEGDTSGVNSGKAYIFNVTTGALLHTLANPSAYSTGVGDNFGNAVAISDTYAVVGAKYEGDASGTNSGKSYIFSVATGQLLWTLNNPNPYGTSADENFGYDVAISGNYVIVGAPYEDESGGGDSGKAYIYNAATGALVKTLDNPNAYSTPTNDYFGLSVAISGNHAIVGAYYEGDSGGTGSGKSYIYELSSPAPTAAPTAAPDSYAASNALLLHFDGSITDVSPQAVFPRTVQLNGSAQLTTAVKKFGTGSLDLTVTGSNVTISAGAVPMFNPANTYTVEGWYNTSYAGNSLPLVTGNANDFYIVNIANTWYCGDGVANPITVQSSSVGAVGQWHHFALSFDASSGYTRFFLDGVKFGETLNRMKNVEITSITLGQLQGVYNRVDGYIDDIRITVGEARYSANFTPPTAAFPNA